MFRSRLSTRVHQPCRVKCSRGCEPIISLHNLLLQIHFLTTAPVPYKFTTTYALIKTLKAILLPYLALIKKNSLYQRFFSTQASLGAGWEEKDVPDVGCSGCCTIRKHSGTLVMGTASQRGGEEVHPRNTRSTVRVTSGFSSFAAPCWSLLSPRQATPFVLAGCWQWDGETHGVSALSQNVHSVLRVLEHSRD